MIRVYKREKPHGDTLQMECDTTRPMADLMKALAGKELIARKGSIRVNHENGDSFVIVFDHEDGVAILDAEAGSTSA